MPAGLEYQVRNANGAGGDHVSKQLNFDAYKTQLLQECTRGGTFTQAGGGVQVLNNGTAGYNANIFFGKSDGTDGYSIGQGVTANDGVFRVYNNGTASVPLAIADNNDATFAGEVSLKSRLNLQRLSGGATTLIQFKNENGVDRAHIDFGGTDEELSFFAGAGSTENMRIDSSGNVGIGTDAPSQRLSLFAGTNESVYDVLGVYNSVTGTTAQNKGAAIRIGIGVDGSYSTKIATIYEGNNPNFLQPALAFYTMHNTYLKDSETEKMRISSNGNVGIGFTSPGSTPLSSMKLSVNGNGYFAGNVGIGTTSPSGKLSVTGTGTASAPTFDVINTSTSQFNHSGEAMAPNMTTGQNNIFVIGVASSTKNSGYIGYKYSGTAGSNANVLTFGHWGSDNLMNIDGLGNVGIGMTSPQYKLDVDGQIRAEGIVNIGGIGVAASGALANVDINDTDTNGTSTSYQPNITFKAAGVLKAQIGKLSGSTNYFTAAKNFDGPVNIIASEIHSGHTHSQEYIFGYEPGNNLNTWGLNLVDGTNTANSLYIGAEGLNSGSSIYFHGTSNALCVTRISLNQSLGQWLFDSPDCGSSNISVKWRQYNMGGYMQNMIDFEDDGDIKNINGSYGTISSDERVKENIVDATSKLDDILSLSVKNFNFIGDNKKQIGLIAQDVESIFPSWVKTSDTRIYKTHDENGVPLEEQGELVSGHEDGKSLKVGMEFAILTKAIQEQQEIIESLKQRIEQLEN